MERARARRASPKTRHALTESRLRELQPGERAYKVSDGGNGLYVVVSPSGGRSFRYDYRLSGRRQTLTIGRQDPAKLAAALVKLGGLDEPPMRFAGGADAVQALEGKAAALMAQAKAYRELSSSLGHDGA